MAAEEAEHRHADQLTALGQVGAPAPEVLAAARERLWAAVAAEMLGNETTRELDAARRDDTTHGDSGARRESAT